MIPAAFEYDRPTTLDEAVGLLALHARTAKVIAGGQSLLPLLKLRLASVDRLIDIGRIAELRGVRETGDGGLSVGALTTYRELLGSVAATRYQLIGEAVNEIGDVQVRNRGTVGGAIAHADPASDLPAVLLALDVVAVARSARGHREIPLERFFTGSFTSDLAHDEILTELRLPAPAAGAGSAYASMAQPASGYSIVGVAAVVARAEGPGSQVRVTHVRVAITGVAEVAYRATAVEAELASGGGPGSDLAAAARRATEGRLVNGDIHADREYRTRMAEVYTRRALEAAIARAG